MKVSKLFHSLYGILMLMPIFAIGVTCLVNVFTKEEVQIDYLYETNEVNSYDDLKVGNIYHLDTRNFGDQIGSFSISGVVYNTVYNVLNYGFDDYYIEEIIYDENGNLFIQNETYMYLGTNTYFVDCNFGFGGWTNSYIDVLIENSITAFEYDDIYIVCDIVLDTKPQLYDSLDISVFSKCENIPFDTANVVAKDKDNTFYKAVDLVENSPMFNWAYSSFLATPILFITDLFSIPNDSFIVMLLSYWLAVAIVWLVFDLIMYLPNLIHSWIDKGAVE